MSIILASASPRRAELLRQLQLDFEVVPANIDESQQSRETPLEYVQRIAQTKAAAIRGRYSQQEVIIAADTTVRIKKDQMGHAGD